MYCTNFLISISIAHVKGKSHGHQQDGFRVMCIQLIIYTVLPRSELLLIETKIPLFKKLHTKAESQ